jgi:hypothetical protein
MKGNSKKTLLRTIASGKATQQTVLAHQAVHPDLSSLTDEELLFLERCLNYEEQHGPYAMYATLSGEETERLRQINIKMHKIWRQ